MEDIAHAATLIIAIGLVLLFGRLVKWILDTTTDDWRPSIPPEGISEDDWNEIYDPAPRDEKGGEWIGFLERYLFLGAFWLGQPILIGVWLAFKLGTKWEVWKDVIRVPENLEKVDQVSYLRGRSKWGSWLLNRFLIGTLMNLLIALVAVTLARGLVWLWQHWGDIVCASNLAGSS